MSVFEQSHAYVVCNWRLGLSHIVELGCRANKSIEKQLQEKCLRTAGSASASYPQRPDTSRFMYHNIVIKSEKKHSFSKMKLLFWKTSFHSDRDALFPPQVFLKSDDLCLMREEHTRRGRPTLPSVHILAMHVQQLEIGALTLTTGAYKWNKLRWVEIWNKLLFISASPALVVRSFFHDQTYDHITITAASSGAIFTCLILSCSNSFIVRNK